MQPDALNQNYKVVYNQNVLIKSQCTGDNSCMISLYDGENNLNNFHIFEFCSSVFSGSGWKERKDSSPKEMIRLKAG